LKNKSPTAQKIAQTGHTDGSRAAVAAAGQAEKVAKVGPACQRRLELWQLRATQDQEIYGVFAQSNVY
jgi:hypothetical protein